MKLLLLLLVLAVVVAWVIGRGRGRRVPPPADKAAPGRDGPPLAMLACARCGVHLPRSDALFDAGGQPFCTAEHRVAGPD